MAWIPLDTRDTGGAPTLDVMIPNPLLVNQDLNDLQQPTKYTLGPLAGPESQSFRYNPL